MMNDVPIVFIGGTGRSGTNILKNILSLHPKICSHPFEYRFIIDPDGIIDFYNSVKCGWSLYMVDNKLKRLEDFLISLSKKSDNKEKYRDFELSRHFPNYEDRVIELMDNLVDFKYEGYWYGLECKRSMYYMNKSNDDVKIILNRFIALLIQDYIKSCNSKLYVEDNTSNICFADVILELLPNAKIIHIKRDPLDTVSSLMNQSWSPSDPIQSATYYNDVMNRWSYVKTQIPPDSFICIDLYNLLDNFEETMRDICNFIGVTYDEVFTKIDLSKSNRGRWKKDLSAQKMLDVLSVINKDKLI